jgi:hypothetical protein
VADPAWIRVALVLVILAWVALFGSLLVETALADELVDPGGAETAFIPLLSGALGLALAVKLGVDPKVRDQDKWWKRLWAVFTPERLVGIGAGIYAISGLLGLIVWWVNEDATPDLVSTVALTVFGYAASAVTVVLAKPRS